MTNRTAFLYTLRYSEIGPDLMAVSDEGYNVLVGSTPKKPNLFTSYADHPRQKIYIPNLKIWSTGAGAYQFLARTFDAYKKLLKLPDFSPASQDAMALQEIREQGGLTLLDAGDFDGAVTACSNIWASLPGAGYGQHENQIAALRGVYTKAGGTLKGVQNVVT